MLLPSNTTTSATEPESRPRFFRLKVGILIFLGILLCVPVLILFTLGIATKVYALKTFHITSDSQCPSVCAGENIFARMNAYARTSPAKGDVVMFGIEGKNYLAVKRIIASEGDIVSQKGDKILINGQVLHLPNESKVCGNIPVPTQSPEDMLAFDPVTVPHNSYFVIGDNLTRSNDSRTPSFGFIPRNNIRGKALLIYMSKNSSRIGCGVS